MFGPRWRRFRIPATDSINKTSGNQVRSDVRSGCWPWGHRAECFTSLFFVCMAQGLEMSHTCLHKVETYPVQSTCDSAVFASVRICLDTHKHRHAAMWNAVVCRLARLRCRVAVGVPGCDPGISVFVLCHNPSLWRDDSPAVPGGDETWDRQSLVVNNNSFMRLRWLPAAFKDLRERQRFSG